MVEISHMHSVSSPDSSDSSISGVSDRLLPIVSMLAFLVYNWMVGFSDEVWWFPIPKHFLNSLRFSTYGSMLYLYVDWQIDINLIEQICLVSGEVHLPIQ